MFVDGGPQTVEKFPAFVPPGSVHSGLVVGADGVVEDGGVVLVDGGNELDEDGTLDAVVVGPVVVGEDVDGAVVEVEAVVDVLVVDVDVDVVLLGVVVVVV